MVRPGEVNISGEARRDELVVCKLLAIVKGDCQTACLVRTQHLDDGCTDWLSFPVGQATRQSKTRHALHQRHQHARVAPPDDGIALPVAQALAAVHHARALLDTHAVLEHPSALMPTAVALAPGFLAAQVACQVATARFVAQDVLVDRLRTDGQHAFERQAPGDLLGREVQAQVGLNVWPFLGRGGARVAAQQLACTRQLLCLIGLVEHRGAVAPELAPDGAARAPELAGNLAGTVSRVMKGLDLVSFVLGQVCVVQSASRRLAGQKDAILCALDPPVLVALHFVLESKNENGRFPSWNMSS